jgi:cholesterol oxidase
MTGCRHNAKNTLVKNYLYLAEKRGAHVHPMTTVTRVVPRHGGGYDVHTKDTRAKTKRRAARTTRTYAAAQVVFAASALGTQRLLHTMKFTGDLPNLSDNLGRLTRTNSESILGAGAAADDPRDFTEGVAITSSFHPDEHTHIEPVRYGRGSNVMSLLTSVLTDDLGDEPRWRVWLKQSWRERSTVRQLYDFKHWSERTVIALVMQSLDNSINTFPKRNRLTGKITLSSEQGHGAPNPTWIPLANEAVRRMARIVGGFPAGNIGEQFQRPLTAHFIGGCPIGKDADHGVVDAYHRVFGYDGLHIVDGSAVSANLGVNPSLTITAQAERAMAYWPNKGEADARPALGTAYAKIPPVAPAKPAVPAAAPAALRLPIIEIS